jgi:hypothetical protein
MTEKKRYWNWTGIIQKPGLERPSKVQEGTILVEMIKLERLKFETESVDILRREEDAAGSLKRIIQPGIGKGETQWKKK